MWSRLVFLIRERGLDVGGWLGSWRLSVVLMTLAGLYYGLLAVWSTSSPPHVVQNIASLLPFWLVYGLLLVNTAVCLWTRFGHLKRQMSPRPQMSHGPADWSIDIDANVSEAGKIFRDVGYRPRQRENGGLWGVRGRWSGLGTYLFHGAFAIVAAGFLLTLTARQEAKVWVATGEEFSSQPEQFLSHAPPRLLSAGVPSVSFRVEKIVPEYWQDQLLFTRLEADLALPDGKLTTTRINRPLLWGWCTFLRLSGFGYAPRYQLLDRRGQVLDSAFVKLNVFPPGQRDFFKIPNYPHRFYVEVLPDFDLVDGVPVTKSLELIRPAVVVRVLRGSVELGGATLVRGDRFDFEGLKIGFPEIRYWGEFSIVQDPGAPIVFAGYLVGLLGLLLKLTGERSELAWQSALEGGAVLRGWGVKRPAPFHESRSS